MPRIDADNDHVSVAETRSLQILSDLRQHLEKMEAEHRSGKLFSNVVIVSDGFAADGEPDFDVITAEESALTVVVGMLGMAQIMAVSQGMRAEDPDDRIVKPVAKTNRLLS